MAKNTDKTIRYLYEDLPGRHGSRLSFFSDMKRRDLVDKTGLIGGVYVNISEAITNSGNECKLKDECHSIIMSLQSRICLAIDADFEVYNLDDLEKDDPQIVQLIKETNLQVYICFDHQSTLIEVLNEKQKGKSRLIQFPKQDIINGQGKEIRRIFQNKLRKQTRKTSLIGKLSSKSKPVTPGNDNGD